MNDIAATASPPKPAEVLPAKRRSWLGKAAQRLVLLLPGIAILVFWQWAAGRLIKEIYVSKPSAVAVRLYEVFSSGEIYPHLWTTGQELVLGYVIGVSGGILAGYALGRSPRLASIFEPYVMAFYGVPKIALAPLFIVWLGVGSSSCIVVAIFIAFFPIVVSTATGLVSAKPEVLQLCRSLTASEWQMFRLARFPYAMPFVFGGMKVGVTMAMIGVIVGEFITAQAGLGYIIMFASSAGETATVLAAIVLLCGIGLALYGIVALGELALLRWYGGEMPVGGVI